MHPYRGEELVSEKVAALRVGLDTEGEEDRREYSQEEHIEAARLMDGYVNRWWLDPIYKGHYPIDIWNHRECLPEIQAGDMEIIATKPDFQGVNYYQRFVVRATYQNGKLTYTTVTPAELGMPQTCLGGEVYPEGLYEMLARLKTDYGDQAIYITENGLAFDDAISEDGLIHDEYRINYLNKHFEQAKRCIADGIDLRGYFVWSLMDNLEWEAGWGHRFGLVHVDYNTLTRTVKDSGWWYRDYIASR
jgi:beta-glucosidase